MDRIDLDRAKWTKSSRSNQNANCVEVALNLAAGGEAPVRDSKWTGGPVVVVPTTAFGEFVRAIKARDL